MTEKDTWTLLLRDFIHASHGLALTLERIVTSFEQISGHISEEKNLAAVTSQFAGLGVRAEMLSKGERSGATKEPMASPPSLP